MPKPYNVFIVYARKDADYLEEIRGHLRPLERAGMLKIWCDREIDPGVKWEDAILSNMDTADLILLMVSAAYYDFSYIHRHQTSKAHLRVGSRLETPAQKEFRGMLSKRNKKTRYGWSGVYWPTISSRTFNEIERFEEIMARVWDI